MLSKITTCFVIVYIATIIFTLYQDRNNEDLELNYVVSSIDYTDFKEFNKDKKVFPSTHYKKIEVTSKIPQDVILSFNSASYYDFKLWELEKGALIKSLHYGNSINLLPENKSNGLMVPLKFNKHLQKEIYIQINDQGFAYNSSFSFKKSNTLIKQFQFEKNTKVITRSITGIFLLIGIFLGIYLKRKIFFIYILNSIAAFVFIESEYGYILNQLPDDVDYKMINLVDAYIFHNTFYFFYYALIHNSKGLDRRIYKTMVISSFIGLLNIPILYFTPSNIPILNMFLVGICVINTFLSYIAVFHAFIKGIQYGKSISYSTFFVFLITTIVVNYFSVLPNIGVIEKTDSARYLFYIIFTFDIIYYIIVILFKYYQIIKDRKELLHKYNNLQRDYSLALLEGQEMEKNRIGRELHDHIGGNLALIDKMENLDMMDKKKIVDNTLQSIDDMIKGLSLKTKKINNSRELLIKLINRYQGNPFQIEVEMIGATPNSPYVCSQFYRITQELLSNAYKHSHATKIFLRYENNMDKDTFNLYYMDNGIGFNEQHEFDGIGLNNMRYRIEKIGGKMFIENQKEGCKISFVGVSTITKGIL